MHLRWEVLHIAVVSVVIILFAVYGLRLSNVVCQYIAFIAYNLSYIIYNCNILRLHLDGEHQCTTGSCFIDTLWPCLLDICVVLVAGQQTYITFCATINKF